MPSTDADHYDLIVLGTGSGNAVPDEDLSEWRIAVVEPDAFGGTCLNRGCIPSKMFVYAADVARHVTESATYGVAATLDGVDWPAVRDRVFGRIDPIAVAGRQYREDLGNTTVFTEPARFVGPRRLRVGDREITGDRVVVAVGSRPDVPSFPGLDRVPYVTSDEVMRLDAQPRRLVIVGGGFIGCEMGHVFDAFGTDVTIVTRGASLLTSHDGEVASVVTTAYRERGIGVHTMVDDLRFAPSDDGALTATFSDDEGEHAVDADLVLVATGRVSNADTLDLGVGGIAVGPDGRPTVDATQATSAEGVWALGDVSSEHWLKHIANAEARTVAHNVRGPLVPVRTDLAVVPSAVFGDPQVASAGATEQELVAAGRDHLRARRDYGSTAYGWAMEDTTSFVKVLVDPGTRLLLGVHAVGPNASLVAQPLIQAMALGNTVDEVARDVVYIHPALSEVVENVLLMLPPAPAG